MVFSSIDFLFKFLPIFLILYGLCPNAWKNTCLFAGSLVFYSYGVRQTPGYLLLFLLSIVVNYKIGFHVGKGKKKQKRKNWLILGLFFNFFILFFFKYAGFVLQNLNRLMQMAAPSISLSLPAWEPVLPIGISFYTFQQMSYLIDVYRGKTVCEKSLVNYGMYVSMFPQLIAGPIVTYSSVKKQMQYRKITPSMVEEGLREFTIGLGLKVLLANPVGSLWREVMKIGFESISTPLAWLGLAAYSFQIYFDFYGYSLMARGLGLVLGFSLPENFNHPYMAVSMTEFWRRWHMTLGSWFREYIYIPLGGNRRGIVRNIGNLGVVWLLTGLWHGASWNFVLWGLLLFFLICMEKTGLGNFFKKYHLVGHLYMLLAIPLTWMVFAITDLSQVGIYIQRLLPFINPEKNWSYYAYDYLKYGRLYAVSLGAGMIFITNGPRKLYRRFKDSPITAVLLLIVFWGCIYCIRQGMDDPFLYFRF